MDPGHDPSPTPGRPGAAQPSGSQSESVGGSQRCGHAVSSRGLLRAKVSARDAGCWEIGAAAWVVSGNRMVQPPTTNCIRAYAQRFWSVKAADVEQKLSLPGELAFWVLACGGNVGHTHLKELPLPTFKHPASLADSSAHHPLSVPKRIKQNNPRATDGERIPHLTAAVSSHQRGCLPRKEKPRSPQFGLQHLPALLLNSRWIPLWRTRRHLPSPIGRGPAKRPSPAPTSKSAEPFATAPVILG